MPQGIGPDQPKAQTTRPVLFSLLPLLYLDKALVGFQGGVFEGLMRYGLVEMTGWQDLLKSIMNQQL